MIKRLSFLHRKPGTSHAEFVEYWTTTHADIARDLPGLRKYHTSVPLKPEAAPYDGVVELYFDDVEACEAAFDSAVGQRVMEDAANFIDLDRTERMYVDEVTQVPGPGDD